MTKQSVVVPAEAAVVPYPPPRAAAVRKKCHLPRGAAQPQMDLGLSKGQRVGGWVESMRSSSPTHAKAAAAGVDDDRAAWMVKHPSALGKFEQLVAASEGKQIVVFLDYDGTLSPIVDDPDAAYMSDTMRRAVRSVAKHFPTAIVSGRCRDKVFEFVRLAELYYAGSHGMDIKGPAPASRRTTPAKKEKQAKRVLFQPASEFLPMIQQAHDSLAEKTRLIPGAKVENNRFCVSVHFRRVDEARWPALADTVRSVMKGYPRLRLTQGRMVFEVRPAIQWDKGRALEFLLDSLGFADCATVLPLYIGDDRTDEDAFRALRRRGHGVGILVSKYPKDTSASYSLQEPAEVMEFLLRLVEWQRLTKSRPYPNNC